MEKINLTETNKMLYKKRFNESNNIIHIPLMARNYQPRGRRDTGLPAARQRDT